jgi:LysM repeat protein
MLPPMTAADADAPRADPAPSSEEAASPAAPSLALPRGCPFLQSEMGGWRLDLPSREHRCAAFSPPAPLAPEKQSRLCLTAAYPSCATYIASLAAREARLGTQPLDRATRWGLARTTTVIEDPGGIRAWLLGALLDRRRWPAIPAVLLVTTLFTLALSGFRADLPATAVATSSPGAPTRPPTPEPTQAATTPPTPAPSGTPEPTTVPTASAAPTPAPTPAPTFRTYRVVPGDTLSAIAARFGTTVQALVDLNDLADPGQLSVGQVLQIPS